VLYCTTFFSISLEENPMCGRFALKAPPRSIQEHFHLLEISDLSPRYNVAPSQSVAVIRHFPQHPFPRLDMLRWGLIPGWASDMKIGYRMINARGETLAQKPSFRTAYKKRRCLVAADGFYEWSHAGGQKQPFYVHLKSGDVFGFAGLWESWNNPEGGILESCTIITSAANALIGKIHDRMPVILSPEHYEAWLHYTTPAQTLQQLLVPYPADKMETYRVGSEVNNPKNDTPGCIKPL
jgi:putative SOS response-associated peptidase YedK